ncbi:MAG: hypothetical protein QM228_04540 [Atribacterota bacterium]|nr:hypothetical protein [Atribacterota bacterium]
MLVGILDIFLVIIFCVWRHSGEAFSLPQTLYFYTFSFFVFMQQSAVIANLIHLRGVAILPPTVVVNLTWQPDNVEEKVKRL